MNKHLEERCLRSREEESDEEEDTEDRLVDVVNWPELGDEGEEEDEPTRRFYNEFEDDANALPSSVEEPQDHGDEEEVEDEEETIPLNQNRVNIMAVCNVCNKNECGCETRNASENVRQLRPRHVRVYYGCDQRDSDSDQDTDDKEASSSTTAHGSSKGFRSCPICGRPDGTVFRIDENGRRLCNQCALHYKNYKTDRTPKDDDHIIKTRNRGGKGQEQNKKAPKKRRPNGSDSEWEPERPRRAMRRNAKSRRSEVPAPEDFEVQMDDQGIRIEEEQHDDRMEEADHMEEVDHMEVDYDFPEAPSNRAMGELEEARDFEVVKAQAKELVDKEVQTNENVIVIERGQNSDGRDMESKHEFLVQVLMNGQVEAPVFSMPTLVMVPTGYIFCGKFHPMDHLFKLIGQIRTDLKEDLRLDGKKHEILEREFVWLDAWDEGYKRRLARSTNLTDDQINEWHAERTRLETTGPYRSINFEERIEQARLFFLGMIPNAMEEKIDEWARSNM